MLLYILMASVSFMNSLTTSPCSFSTTNTSSGLAIRLIITRRIYTGGGRGGEGEGMGGGGGGEGEEEEEEGSERE